MEWSILGVPLVAGLLVVISHVLLGREVLCRGIIFIDLCIAQVAALGIIVANSLHLAEAGWLTQTIAIGFALLAAALLAWTETRWRAVQEAIIGSLYVLSASIGMLVLAHDPHGSEQLNQLLAGQILWVTWAQLGPLSLATLLVVGLWAVLPGYRQRLFYFLFAIAVTASVQIVGVFLVFATLILPALAVHRSDSPLASILGYLIAAAGYVLGLGLSLLFDIPAGPLIVCTLAAGSLLVLALRGWIHADRPTH